MQTESQKVAFAFALIVGALFLGAVFSGSRERAKLMGLATLGLGVTNAFLRIGQKERTAR